MTAKINGRFVVVCRLVDARTGKFTHDLQSTVPAAGKCSYEFVCVMINSYWVCNLWLDEYLPHSV